MTPTEEQLAILEAVRSTKDNLLINALAGAAKTTTLVMIAGALPLQPTLSVAFNKKIADEMGRRLPGHVESRTMNSLGHRVWGGAIGKRLVVSTDKMYTILKALITQKRPDVQRDYQEIFAQILRATRMAKSAGYIPPKGRSLGKPLLSEEEDLLTLLYSHIEVDIDDKFLSIFDDALMLSISEAYSGNIDFDDQIYMPTLFGGMFPRYPQVLVDETQDLSPLNHRMLELIYGGRIIAVGDPWQSIYAFRGAHHGSMEAMKQTFSMKEMNLSISFRCPQSVVRRAHSRVPHMKWPDGAAEGKVLTLLSWDQSSVPEGAAIICRNNAPLFRLGMELIRDGRGVHIHGNDIGANLVKLMKKLAPAEVSKETFTSSIEDWRKRELAKAHKARKSSIEDRAECLLVFASFGQTSTEAIAYAEHLFSAAGPIALMTGHKSKGLEFDVVFHLDPFLVPSKQAVRAAESGESGALEQELNLRYVIETRAKKELYLVTTEDYS